MRGPLKSIAEKVGAVATKTINKGSLFVAKNAESAYKSGKAAAMERTLAASKGVSGSFDRVYTQGKDATLSQVTAATKRASASLASASKEASHVVRDASTSIASSAKEAAKEAAVEAKIEAKRGIRWLMVWSLVAVGVYGVATTVSKELVRHLLVGTKREDHLVENKQSERSDEGDASGSRWSWLSSTKPKKSEPPGEDNASGVGRILSWLS
ncbi:MAG: hypothetical protein SGBAC_005069 [Bacillariaceae sp.]